MYDRVLSVKGFNWKREMDTYLPSHDNGAVTGAAVIERDNPEPPINHDAYKIPVAAVPIEAPTPPQNPDDDVSVVIFGGLEERTRRLFQFDPDKHHVLNSGFLSPDDYWIDI